MKTFLETIRASLSTRPSLFKMILICSAVLVLMNGQGQLVFSAADHKDEEISDSRDDTPKDSLVDPKGASPSLVDNAPTLPSATITEWLERHEKLSESVQTGRLDYKAIDAFYWELNAALKDKRNLFREAMAALTSAPVKKPKGIEKKVPAESYSKDPDLNKSETSPLKPDDRAKWFLIAEQHQIDMTTLYNLRI